MWNFWDERRIKEVEFRAAFRWETVGGWIVGTKVDNGISQIPHFPISLLLLLLLLLSFTVISATKRKESLVHPN